MPKSSKDNQPDLLEAVDQLLEEIEETAKAYAPKEGQEIDSNSLLTDDGTHKSVSVDTTPEPQTPLKAEPEDSEPEPPVDSIENAKQALEALDEVEGQAAELAAQGIDALLQDSREATEASETTAEESTEPQTPSASEIDQENDDLLSSIDDLLEETAGSDTENSPTESSPEDSADSESGIDPAPKAESTADAGAETDTESLAAEPKATENTAPEADTQTQETPEPRAELSEEDLITQKTESSADAEAESIDMLDSALAEAADDMLEGDFEDEEGELVSGDAVASPIEEALESQEMPSEDLEQLLAEVGDNLLGAEDALDEEASASTAEPEDTTETPEAEAETNPQATDKSEAAPQAEPGIETQLQPAPAAAPIKDPEVLSEIEALGDPEPKDPISVPAWFERAVEICRPKIDQIDPLKGKSMDAIAMVLGGFIVLTMTHATPIAARVMILTSKPMAKKSPEIRNAVGFIALWTAFLAIALWLYLLMFRSPSIPQPETAPTRVISADELLTVRPVVEVLP